MAVAEQLHVEVRESRGKQAAKQMRRAGKLPGVVYSQGGPGTAVTVETRAFKTIMRHHGTSGLVELDGLPDGKTLAIYKELNLHPVSYEPVHVDFQAVKADEIVDVDVKIELQGLPVGVDLHGGVLMRATDAIPLCCKPADIPELITIDVKHLDIGDALHLSDIELPEGVSMAPGSGKLTIASVSATREAASKKGAKDAEGEGEEAEAEGAEAAAPAK